MNIEDLISQYIDGDLSSEAEAEMHHRLAVSPEARKLFRAQIALREAARNAKVLHAPTPELRAKLFRRLEHEEGMKPLQPMASMLGAMAEIPRSIPSRSVERDSRRRRRAIAWLLPTMVASIVAVALVWNAGDPLGRPAAPVLADRGYPVTAVAPKSEPVPELATADLSPSSGSAATSSADPAISDAVIAEADGGVGVGSAGNARSLRAAVAANPSRSHDNGRRAAVAEPVDPDASGGNGPSAENAPASSPMAVGSLPVERIDAMAKDDRPEQTPRTAQSPAKSTIAAFEGVGYGRGKFQKPEVKTLGADGAHESEGRVTTLANEEGGKVNRSNPPMSPPSTQSQGASDPRLASSGTLDTIGRVANRVASQPVILAAVSAVEGRSEDQEHSPMIPDRGWEAEPHFSVSLHQLSFVGSADGRLHLDMALRVGGRPAGGHILFAMVGMSGYHESIAEKVVQRTVGGTERRSIAISTMGGERYEPFAGVGYQYIIRISRRWGAGAGAWSSVGSRYLRAGIELPVSYAPNQRFRLELLPSVRYSSVHGGTTTTNERWELSAGEEQTLTRTVAPDGDAAVDIGIGVGASLLW